MSKQYDILEAAREAALDGQTKCEWEEADPLTKAALVYLGLRP